MRGIAWGEFRFRAVYLLFDFIQDGARSAAHFQEPACILQTGARQKILAQTACPTGLLLEAPAPVRYRKSRS